MSERLEPNAVMLSLSQNCCQWGVKEQRYGKAWVALGKWPPLGESYCVPSPGSLWLYPEWWPCWPSICPDWMTADPSEQLWPAQGLDLVSREGTNWVSLPFLDPCSAAQNQAQVGLWRTPREISHCVQGSGVMEAGFLEVWG